MISHNPHINRKEIAGTQLTPGAAAQKKRRRKIIVLGNGPSLKPEHFEYFSGVDTLGMNAAYRFWRRIGWYPAVYTCLDDQVVISHADEIWKLVREKCCRHYFLHHGILDVQPQLKGRDNVVFLPQMLYGEKHAETCRRLGLEHAPNKFFQTRFGAKLTTGSYSVRFAASLGYEEIGLVGIDCRYKEVIQGAEKVEGNILKIAKAPKSNPNYFFDDYQQEGDIYNLPNPAVHDGNLHLQSFFAVSEDFKKFSRRINIKVCTKESELYDQKVFEYESLEKFANAPRLSAIFVPFVEAEVPKLIDRFCSWGVPGFTPYAVPPETPSVELHLAFNKDKNISIERQLITAYEDNDLWRYFAGICFHYSNLSGLRDLYTRETDGPCGAEGYMAGPNNQFFDIIQRFSSGMSHIALIEADVAPIRAGWLKKIERIVEQPDKFWICGSHYRGVGPVQALWHVNGNAIYNVGDEEFQQFFDKEFLPHFRRQVKKSPRSAYDTVLHDMFRGVFSGSKSDALRKSWSACAHRIRFSDFVVDVSHDEDRKPENLLDLSGARASFPESRLFHGAVTLIDQEVLKKAASLTRRTASNLSHTADIIFIDPDAVDWFGHFMAYNDKFAAAAEKLGHRVKVACNTKLLPEILKQRPNFYPGFTVASRFVGKDRNNAESMSVFEAELSAVLDEIAGPQSILYMYCGSLSHAEVIACQLEKRPGLQANVNLMYESFGECDTPLWHKRWKYLAEKTARVGKRLKITTPTPRLQQRMRDITGYVFDVPPHPSTALSDEEFSFYNKETPPTAPVATETFRVLFPGSARRGKGFELALDAAASIASLGVEVQLRSPVAVEVKRTQSKLDDLPPQVSVIEGSLDNAAYCELFRRAHVSVLLYDPDAFANRTSGLLIDSIYYSLPVVTLKGSWLGDVVERYGCGVVLDHFSPEAICNAIETIRADYDSYYRRARDAARRYFASNSWAKLAAFVANSNRPQGAPSTMRRLLSETENIPNVEENKFMQPRRRMLILGNGPSTAELAKCGFDKIPADVDTFGMGAAYRYFSRVNWWPTYYALGDSKVVHSHREALTRLIHDPEIPTRRFYFPLPLSTSPKFFRIPHSSTGDFCFRKSIELGYNEIYLIGIEGAYVEEIAECRPLSDEEFSARGFEALNLPPQWRKLLIITKTPESNPNYFFDDYQQEGDIYSLPQANTHQDAWAYSASQDLVKSCRVYNLSDQSSIRAFPFQSIDKFLASEITPEQCSGPDNENDIPGFERDDRMQVNETEVVSYMLSLRRGKQNVMLDVGANIGRTAALFQKLGWTVYCCEPDPKNVVKLSERFQSAKNLIIDPRAVSDAPAKEVAFYTSSEASSISSLLAFRDTHEATARVEVTTVAEIAKSQDYSRIDFLKIDVEGLDFAVLKGVPWDRLMPDVIECEFEDAKTEMLGHSWRDIAEFLRKKGYSVYISEWHPIIRYGIAHDWKRVVPYPAASVSKEAWGNLLAFREDPGFDAVRAAFEAVARRREAAESARTASEEKSPKDAITIKPNSARAGSSSTKAQTLVPKRPFYAFHAERLMARAPRIFTFLRFFRRTVYGLWRRRVFTLPALGLVIAMVAFGYHPSFAEQQLLFWIGAGFVAVFFALFYIGLRVFSIAIGLQAELIAIRRRTDDNRKNFDKKLKELERRIHARFLKSNASSNMLAAQIKNAKKETHAVVGNLVDENERLKKELLKTKDEVTTMRNSSKADSKALKVALGAISHNHDETAKIATQSRRLINIRTREAEWLRERIAASERQIGALRYPHAPDCFVFFGHHKCGSRFFRNQVFARIAEMTGARQRKYEVKNPPFHYSRMDELDLNNIDFADIGDGGRDVVMFANATRRSLDKIRSSSTDWKGVRVLRDPRQVLVSNYFHHKDGHPTEDNGWVWDKLVHDRPILNELDEEEGLLYELNNISKEIIETQLLEDFDDERILSIKLEEFAKEPKHSLALIANFLEVPDIAGIDLDARSANPESGPWPQYFSSQLKTVFKKRYGEHLIALGYARDLDW